MPAAVLISAVMKDADGLISQFLMQADTGFIGNRNAAIKIYIMHAF